MRTLCKLGLSSLCVAAGLYGSTLHAQVNLSAPAWRIGVLDGDPRQEFGLITAVQRSSRGNVFVLDERSYRISVFNAQGEWMTASGRAGSGPGEYRYPRAISLLSDDTLLVLDPANRRISKLALSSRSLEFVESFRVDVEAADLCVLRGDVYVLGYAGGHVIHQFTAAGRHVRSFGEPFGPDHSILRISLASGLIACIAETNTILAASSNQPEVRSYRADGSLLWTYVPLSIRRFNITQNPNGSVTFASPPDGYHTLKTLTSASRNLLLLQFALFRGASRHADDFEAIESRLLDLRTGRELTVQENLPRLAWVRAPFAISSDNREVPVASLHRYSLRER